MQPTLNSFTHFIGMSFGYFPLQACYLHCCQYHELRERERETLVASSLTCFSSRAFCNFIFARSANPSAQLPLKVSGSLWRSRFAKSLAFKVKNKLECAECFVPAHLLRGTLLLYARQGRERRSATMPPIKVRTCGAGGLPRKRTTKPGQCKRDIKRTTPLAEIVSASA